MKKATTTKTTPVTVPTPVCHDSRICFGINYYATEVDADAAHKAVRARGDEYNGGWFHGMACGRAPEFDYNDDVYGARLYAVTVA